MTAAAAAARLAELTGAASHDVAVVLGSGWASAADRLGVAEVELAFTALPGFLPPAVDGHAGRLRSIVVRGRRVLVLLGRTHLYEGRGTDAVVHGVRVAAAAGCRAVVLTNAAGAVREGLRVGQAVLVSDHLNLTACSPLTGARFVDLVDLYSARLRALAREVDPDLVEGVYAALPGPHYETPAEVRMLAALGGHAVGMSTVLECIAARWVGLEVCGVSLVTNAGAGYSGEPLTHEEVLAEGQIAGPRLAMVIRRFVAELPTG